MSNVRIIVGMSLFLGCLTAQSIIAATPVLRINWRDRPIPAGTSLLLNDAFMPAPQLKVVSSVDVPTEVTLYSIETTCLNDPQFFVSGQVRWENSAGQAELILVCEHANGATTENRVHRIRRGTIKQYPLYGSGDWSDYHIGYSDIHRKKEPVKRFALVLRMPAKGTFYFGPSLISEGDWSDLWNAIPGEWWGRGFMILPFYIPIIVAMSFVQRSFTRKAPSPLTWMILGCVTMVGLVGLIAGIVAVAVGQPFHVYIGCFTIGTSSCCMFYIRAAQGRLKTDLESSPHIPSPVLQ